MITRLGNHHLDEIPRDSRGAVGSMQRMSAVIAPHRWRFGKKSSRNGRCAILRGGLEHLFFSIYWESSSQLTNIFQRGWNHQPALLCLINMGDVPVVSSLIPISSLKWPGDFGATPFSWLAARDLALSLSLSLPPSPRSLWAILEPEFQPHIPKLSPAIEARYSSPTKFKPWHSTQLQDPTAGCLRMPCWSSKVGYAWPAQPPTINTPEVAASSAAPDPSAPCMTLLPGEYWVCGKSMNYPISIYIYINISLLSLIYHYYSY